MSAVAHLELVFSRPETTLSVTRGAARLMMDMGYAPLLEVCLPNGRRADVLHHIECYKCLAFSHLCAIELAIRMAGAFQFSS